LKAGEIDMRDRIEKYRGFMAADTMAGIALLTVVGTFLAVAVHRQGRATQQLADSRVDDRKLEVVLLHLQSGDTSMPDEVSLRKLDTPAPSGRSWVEVSLSRGRSSALVGLVPADAADRFIKGAAPSGERGQK
jgi:hypothetical protein